MTAIHALSDRGGDSHRSVASLVQGCGVVLKQYAWLVFEPDPDQVDAEAPELGEFCWTIMALEWIDVGGRTWKGAALVGHRLKLTTGHFSPWWSLFSLV